MMNQKVGIYIILSVVLLYLYYKRGDLAIFAAFVAVVAGTLIFRVQTDDREGFGFGGGGGGGDCAKMGFKPIKLDKDDLPGSLEKAYKSIKKIADKRWPYFDKDVSASNKDAFSAFMEVVKTSAEKLDKDDNKKMEGFVGFSYEVYRNNRMDIILSQKPENLKNFISGGEITFKVLEKLSKSDEIDSGFKKNFKYLNCLCKYWINLYKEVQKANGGGGGDDEEEKPKKTKKKASEDDEGGGDDEEEEKPKKKKNKKASEDDDE